MYSVPRSSLGQLQGSTPNVSAASTSLIIFYSNSFDILKEWSNVSLYACFANTVLDVQFFSNFSNTNDWFGHKCNSYLIGWSEQLHTKLSEVQDPISQRYHPAAEQNPRRSGKDEARSPSRPIDFCVVFTGRDERG